MENFSRFAQIFEDYQERFEIRTLLYGCTHKFQLLRGFSVFIFQLFVFFSFVGANLESSSKEIAFVLESYPLPKSKYFDAGCKKVHYCLTIAKLAASKCCVCSSHSKGLHLRFAFPKTTKAGAFTLECHDMTAEGSDEPNFA